ncbi:NAD-dependent epimerase/dehydratase family protein [Cedecea sp. FDAARGOS_727]|nr:NAD-dependent epimerase/dehydratase family protein [Cedecea sp. FDAARGOS_727]
MGSEQRGVLITGGAGFIGKALIRELTQRQIPVVSFDIADKPESLPECSKMFQWYKFSYLESSSRKKDLEEIVSTYNIKVVIHLATTLFPGESKNKIEKDCFENVYSNVCFFKNLYESGCEKIIFASSGGTVYGKSDTAFSEENDLSPEISYGLSKSITETYLRFLAKEYNCKSISLRISNPYGDGQRIDGKQGVIPIFLNKISKEIPIDIIGSLNSKRDYIYIKDLVHAFIEAINYEGKENIFNIGSGESTTLKELIAIIESKLNKKSLIGAQELHNNDSRGITLNIQRAINELNWQPVTKLSDGIDKLIQSIECRK